jgi:hypothetical protein
MDFVHDVHEHEFPRVERSSMFARATRGGDLGEEWTSCTNMNFRASSEHRERGEPD